MDKSRLQKLAGLPVLTEMNEVDIDRAERSLVEELGPIKDQLEVVMKKYPHAEWDNVLNWLKQ